MPRCSFPDAQTKSSVFRCRGSRNQSRVKWCLQNNCGICRRALAVTDGRGLPPGTGDGVPDWSCSLGEMSTDVWRRLLSCFDWQPWRDRQSVYQLFARCGGSSVATLETWTLIEEAFFLKKLLFIIIYLSSS